MIERHKTPEYYQGCRVLLEYIRPQYLAAGLEAKIAEYEAEVMDAMAKDACTCRTMSNDRESIVFLPASCPVHGGAA